MMHLVNGQVKRRCDGIKQHDLSLDECGVSSKEELMMLDDGAL